MWIKTGSKAPFAALWANNTPKVFLHQHEKAGLKCPLLLFGGFKIGF
jgi:hypothetical protein